jgi:hypothetical protein
MAGHRGRCVETISDDLGTPRAMAVAHEIASASDLSDLQRRALLLDFDRVLSLSLDAPAAPDGLAPLCR